MNKKRLWTRGAAWLLTLCLLAGLCVPIVRAEENIETTEEAQENTSGSVETSNPLIDIDMTDEPTEETDEDIVEEPINESDDSEALHEQLIAPYALGVGKILYQDFFLTVSVESERPGSGNQANGQIGGQSTDNGFTTSVKSAYNAQNIPLVGKIQSYPISSVTLVVQNNYAGYIELSFTRTVNPDKGTVKMTNNGSSTTWSGSGTNDTLKILEGQSAKITIESQKRNPGYSLGVQLSISGIKVKPEEKTAKLTCLPPDKADRGTYTVAVNQQTAETVGAEGKNLTLTSADIVTLTATAATGYKFAGWIDGNEKILSRSAKFEKAFGEDAEIKPVFVPKDNPIFSVGEYQFYTLTEADKYATSQSGQTIYLLEGGTLPEEDRNSSVSAGNTLLIPFSESKDVHTTKPSTINSGSASSGAYRTLIIPDKTTITVYGAINVDSQVTQMKSFPTGKYGLITLSGPNSKIILEKDSNLYCWGYINGAGVVQALTGSNVYECFQIQGWRGGGASQDMVGGLLGWGSQKGKVFPINQYYIQNVEAMLELYYDATEYVYVSVIVGGSQQDTVSKFIANGAGMFRVGQDGKLVKKYDASEDRMIFTVNGTFTVAPLTVRLTIDLKSEEYPLPINNNFTIDIQSGTTTIDSSQKILLLPGSEFKVSKGATFIASSDFFVYDQSVWVGKKYACFADLNLVSYTTTAKKKRTSEELDDAHIDVNGTMIVNGGKLYTTEAKGANIESSKGSGKIIFQTAAANSNTISYQVVQTTNSVSDSDYVEIPVTPARLKNGSTGEGAKPYTETSGAPAGAVYYYDVDEFGNGSKNWYRFNVTYVINGTSDTKQLNTETKLSDVTINGTIESVTATVTNADGKPEQLKDATGKAIDKSYVTQEDKTLDIRRILTAVQEYDAKNGYKNMGNVTISITTNNKGSSHPMFVLSAKQLRIYQSFGGTATFAKLTDKPGYYLVKDITDPEKQIGGTPCTADVDMHVPGDYAMFGWYMGEGSDAQEFGNVVPGLDGRIVYIYGRYSGYAVEMDYPVLTHPSNYYTTIAEAMSYVTDVGNITYTLKMLADNDAFADDGGKYTIPVNRDITLDLNGFTVTGTITNNGTLTIRDSTHSEKNDGTGKVTSVSNNTITNAGTLTLESGKFVSTGGATAVMNNGTLNVRTGAAFNGENTDRSHVISGEANYPDGYQLSTSRVEGYFRVKAIPKNVHLTGSKEDYFETLQDAINAAEAGDTLILLEDVSGSAVFDKNLTLDLNEHTSSGNITVNSDVTLTIKGTGTISASGTAVLNKGTLILPTGIKVEATGTNGIALDNRGTIDSITGGTFTGHVAVQVDGTGSITEISGGDFISSGNGGHAVNVGANGTIGTISGGTFKANKDSHVLVNNTSNPIKLEGTARFGGVSLRSGVMESESSFTFNDGYTLSTKADEGDYFTIVPNTFTLVFDVDGELKKETVVSRSGDVDLSSLYGADPEKTGYQFNGWTYNGTNIGKETVTQAQLRNPGTGDTVTVYATWNVVYSVTITWGSLEYEYKGATYVWDGQNMKYTVKKDAHWESVNTNNTVKVENNTVATEGTVQVKAKYENTGDYMFDLLLQNNTNNTSLTTEQMLGTVAPKGGIQSWSFLLDGTPSGKAFTQATVGKITLTLQPAP